MSLAIHKLLAKGTSPVEFQSILRRKTRAIRQFDQPLEKLNMLQARIPGNVSGGEILELMSGRLRQLLQHMEMPEKILSVRKSRSGSACQPIGIGTSRRDGFPNQPDSVAEPASQFSSGGRKSCNRAEAPSIIDSKGWNIKASASPSLLGDAGAEVLSESVTTHRLPQPFTVGERDHLPNRNRSAPLEASVFLRKLQEYRQLTQSEDTSEPDSRNRPVPELTEEKPPVFPASLREGRSAGSWYEMSGQEVAERLRAFTLGNGNLPSSSIWDVPSGSSEPVRVQNVFHIEVQGQGIGDTSFGDLSTKVADILREQAIQHGIDLT